MMFRRMLNLRLWSLFIKEFHQIRRNRRLVIMLIVPPTLNIVLFGFALNPNFENLRLGVVDYSATPESRELVSDFTQSLVFKVAAFYPSPNELGQAISKGNLDAGLVIPKDFAEKRLRRETASVQLLVDAVNANTATITGGYAARIIGTVNQKIAASQPPRQGDVDSRPDAIAINVPTPRATVTPHLTLLY